MPTDGPMLDAARIRDLLTELGARLDQRGVHARLFVVGGAAMALAYSRDRVTRDIDAVFEPKTIVYEEAHRMAADHGLPDDWLNDGVKGLLPGKAPATADATSDFDAPGITVGVAAPGYMFAMKAAAARSASDRDDLHFLANTLGIRTPDEAFGLIEQYYDKDRLTPKTQFFVEEIIAELG